MPTDVVPAPVHSSPAPAPSRRGFLRAATIIGGRRVAAVVAANGTGSTTLTCQIRTT